MLNFLIIASAKWLIILPVILCLVVLWRLESNQRRVRYVIILIATGVLALILSRIGSALISDPRPFVAGHFVPLISHAADNGFPSDHTLLAAALGFATLAFSKRYGVVILILAALVGAARVAAGVHHVEDIIGSFVISGIAFAIVFGIARLVFRRPATDEPE